MCKTYKNFRAAKYSIFVYVNSNIKSQLQVTCCMQHDFEKTNTEVNIFLK